MLTSSKRDRSKQAQDNTKQHRELELCCGCGRLRGAYFPTYVLALPHVLTQIDTLLMTPEEAIMEAARSGEAVWLRQLLLRFECCVPNALVPAAANGHLECVDALLNKFFGEETFQGIVLEQVCYEQHFEWRILRHAVVIASGRTDLNVLRLLWETFNPLKYQDFSTARAVLSDAAGNGHFDVVKFVVQDAMDANYTAFMEESDALSRAISERHADVVEFLLGLDGAWWDLAGVYVAAVEAGEDALVDRVLSVCLETFPYTRYKNYPLLVQLTWCDGWTNAVKYLYNHGENDPDAVNDAFVSAAKRGFTATVEFLLGTNRVLPATFSEAMQAAATSLRNNTDTMKFLCSTRHATPSSVDRAFVDATNAELVRFLYENERISDEAIVAAFEKASGWGLQYWRFTFDANRTEIVKLLHEDSRIPGEVLGEALVRAANAGHAEVVALLCHDTRISDELRGKAFAEASTCENSDLMLSLYDKQRTPPDAVSTALCDAYYKTPQLKRLVQLVFTDDEVPRERKRRIIAGAVELGCKRIQQTLHDCGVEDWPLDTLENGT